MKKIMILGASILQVPAIKKAKEMGLQVIAVDGNESAVGFDYADVKLVISTVDIDNILKAAKDFKIDGILTIATDQPMLAVAKVVSELGLSGVSPDTAVKATNKLAMRDALFANQVPVPIFFKISNFNDFKTAVQRIKSQGLSCIVKPVDSSGSRGVELVETTAHDEMLEIYNYSKSYSKTDELIVEEFMEGPEVSVETLSINGTCHVIQITDKLTTGKPFFVEMGHSQPSQLDPSTVEEIKRITINANKAIGIVSGPSHTEVKITKDGPKIIELGARLGGDNIATHLVPLSTGVDMVESCIKLALGEETTISRKFNKGSAISYLSAEPGMVSSIMGLDDARKLEGVKQVSIVHGVGSESKEIKSSVDRLGFIIAQADTPRQAISLCEQAKERITITVQK